MGEEEDDDEDIGLLSAEGLTNTAEALLEALDRKRLGTAVGSRYVWKRDVGIRTIDTVSVVWRPPFGFYSNGS